MTKPIKPYTALVIQPHVKVAETRAEIKGNLDRVVNMIDFGVGYFWELPARLVVLPEYFLQGVTTPGKGEHGIESFMKKAIELDGPEMARLGEVAKEYGIYIAGGGVIEKVKEFPDRWFNSAFIIGPSGKVRTALSQMAHSSLDWAWHQSPRSARAVSRSFRNKHRNLVPRHRH